MRDKIIYNPHLSITENAINNGVTESAIRKYIRENNIDRRGDEKRRKYKMLRNLLKDNPNLTKVELSKLLGWSVKTIKKYFRMVEQELFDTEKVSIITPNKQMATIKSVSYSNDEILGNIMRLYLQNKPFDADFTYSIGEFYKRLPKPILKYDVNPMTKEVKHLDETYKLEDGTLNSIVVDLPFVIRAENKNSRYSTMIEERFTAFRSYDELCNANDRMLILSYAKLRKGGYLIMKTMDVCHIKQRWVSVYVTNKAYELGYELEDMFILINAKGRIIATNQQQRHARKWHSYILVFRK